MATLNQFQQYSQTENTVTNNILLMLSNLYVINPKYYEDFIRGITEDEGQFSVIPIFRQQVGNKGDGIIDGHIQTKASKIIIETKLHSTEWINKLFKYTKSFDFSEYKILIHLSSKRYSDNEITEIENKLKDLKEKIGNINFQSITYQDLVGQLVELTTYYPYEIQLQRLKDDFEEYCQNMGLLPKPNNFLRAMACGESFDLNVNHKFYFDVASRGYSDFKYLGIYKWKAVKYIGLVENMIVANWNEQTGLKILNSESDVTNHQKERLINAIKDSMSKGWEINNDHRFFLLKEFTQTNFKKTSPGGIFRVRFFNLEKILSPFPSETYEIAEQLKHKTWE